MAISVILGLTLAASREGTERGRSLGSREVP